MKSIKNKIKANVRTNVYSNVSVVWAALYDRTSHMTSKDVYTRVYNGTHTRYRLIGFNILQFTEREL